MKLRQLTRYLCLGLWLDIYKKRHQSNNATHITPHWKTPTSIRFVDGLEKGLWFLFEKYIWERFSYLKISVGEESQFVNITQLHFFIWGFVPGKAKSGKSIKCYSRKADLVLKKYFSMPKNNLFQTFWGVLD